MMKDARRTLAHFLNSLAVAVLATGAIGPAVLGTFNVGIAAVAVAFGLVLHAAALWASGIG